MTERKLSIAALKRENRELKRTLRELIAAIEEDPANGVETDRPRSELPDVVRDDEVPGRGPPDSGGGPPGRGEGDGPPGQG